MQLVAIFKLQGFNNSGWLLIDNYKDCIIDSQIAVAIFKCDLNSTHCAIVQKYKQGKIGLQFFDMWY